MVFYFDMDGVLVEMPKLDRATLFKKLNSPYWVSNLSPYVYNVNIVRWLIQQGHTVYILSRAMNEANKRGKRAWLKKYIPALPDERIILIDDNNKENHMREYGILVDDTERNCKLWYEQGAPAYYVYPKGANIYIDKLLAIPCEPRPAPDATD